MNEARFVPVEHMSVWRKLALASWKPPLDPSIYGTLEVDAEALLAWMELKRKATGAKITVTHAVARATAVLLRTHPDLNCCIRRGKLYQRTHVDVFLQVAVPAGESGVQSADLSGAKIMDADVKPIDLLARELAEKAERIRKRDDPMLASTKRSMAWMPTWLARPVMRMVAWLSDQAGFDLRWMGVPRDPFGSAMITSVGMLGLSSGFAPLFPLSICPFILMVGAVEEKPVVRDGNVVARPILPLYATLDHRVIDGFHASVMAREMKRLLGTPANLDSPDG